MRLFVFATSRVEASVSGLSPSKATDQEFDERFFLDFNGAQGLKLRDGDWIQVIQKFGDSEADRCLEYLNRSAFAVGCALIVLDMRTFKVVKWPTSMS